MSKYDTTKPGSRRPVTTVRGGKPTSSSRSLQPEVGHRATDIAGLCLLGTAILLLAALLFGHAGVVGDGLTQLLGLFVGRGAWAVPVVLGLAGIALLAGRKQADSRRTLIGLLIIYFATLGMLSREHAGDWFDPEGVALSGGYLGAIIGWAFDALFGVVRGVVLTVVALVGLVLTLDMQLREIAGRLARRAQRRAIPSQTLVEDTARKDRIGAAVTKARATDERVPSVVPEEPEKTAKATPVFRDEPQAVTLNLDTPSPREGYELPPLSLLSEPVSRPKRSPQEMQRNIETLENTLDQFGIEANVVEVATGPTITRYEIQLGPGIRVGRITALADNIAMNLAASHVRVEAPIPGKSAIGVEVPNTIRSMVALRDLCESLEFHDSTSKLTVALGKDVSGVNQYTDLTRMPHLLIGGATNSGKSICLTTILMSLILKNTPKDLRLVMVDPKRVELTFFEALPHLMCPVVKDVKEAPGVLRAVWREMDRRYDRFSEAGVRNIEGWNAKASFQDRLPYIVVVIDELADLMIQAAAEVETSICRLAQLARATGIHLVIATQRPSVDVITGTIKANISSRIAFAVSSQIDSRTILDQGGAERLIGKGDMLFMPIDATKPTRIQGCYISEKEIEAVCEFWRKQEKPHYVLNPIQVAIEDREAQIREQEESDPLWEDSVRWVADRGQASTSMLQRRFSIGFQRASRLLDLMEERGIVGPRDGPRPREVLKSPLDVESMFGGRTYSDEEMGYLSDED